MTVRHEQCGDIPEDVEIYHNGTGWIIEHSNYGDLYRIYIKHCPYCGEKLFLPSDMGESDDCQHLRAEMVPSYYSDTEWCPDCGASRGTDEKFGPGSKMLEWKLPASAKSKTP